MSAGSPSFWRIVQVRVTSVTMILAAAWYQVPVAVAFQTITNSQIITPSAMGSEPLYRLVQTSIVLLSGITGLTSMSSTGQYLTQVGPVVALAVLLHGWMLRNERINIHQTFLLGIVIGTGPGILSIYMQNLLNPSVFDTLNTGLIGGISDVDVSQLAVTTPLALVTGGLLLTMPRTPDVLGLGRDTVIGLGVDHCRNLLAILMLVTVLMVVSISPVGPVSLLGFPVAMTAYQLSDTREYRLTLLMAWLVGVVILDGAYFVLRHIFYATGFVDIIIGAAGDTFFLIHLLRGGRPWSS